MKKNTLFHHKKNQTSNFMKSKDNLQKRDSFIENPQNSAKFCLLQISQEAQKINNRTFTAFQSHHSRSFSTELIPQQKMIRQNKSNQKEQKNFVKSERYRKAQSHQSVILKSTFSNEMRKTSNLHLNRKQDNSNNQSEQKQLKQDNVRWESLKKLRKINYVPLAVQQSKQIQKIDEIFQSTPSRQILAILKRTNLAKEISQNDKRQKSKSEEKIISARKRSIFNIRHLMMKQKITGDSGKKQKQSPEMKDQINKPVKSKDLHSNNYNVVKMRLKNRYNQSAMDSKK